MTPWRHWAFDPSGELALNGVPGLPRMLVGLPVEIEGIIPLIFDQDSIAIVFLPTNPLVLVGVTPISLIETAILSQKKRSKNQSPVPVFPSHLGDIGCGSEPCTFGDHM